MTLRNTLFHPAVGIALLFLGGAEAVIRLAGFPSYFIIPPSAIPGVLWKNHEIYFQYLMVTLKEAGIGFLGGTFLALTMATFLTLYPRLRQGCLPLAIAAQTTPVVVYATYMLIVLGPGEEANIIVAGIFLFFSTLIVVTRGLSEIDPTILDAVHLETNNQWLVMFRIRFPLSIPYLVSALKIGVTSAILGAVIAEWVNGGSTGLGHLLLLYKADIRTADFLGAAVVTVLASIVSYALMAWLEKLVKWEYR